MTDWPTYRDQAVEPFELADFGGHRFFITESARTAAHRALVRVRGRHRANSQLCGLGLVVLARTVGLVLECWSRELTPGPIVDGVMLNIWTPRGWRRPDVRFSLDTRGTDAGEGIVVCLRHEVRP